MTKAEFEQANIANKDGLYSIISRKMSSSVQYKSIKINYMVIVPHLKPMY